MGQQQLLLIVLGVILVGVAVVLGIQYFGVGAEEGAKDEIVAHSLIIGSNAQEWFKKPISMGGGGLSFTGYPLPASLDSSTNGYYVYAAQGGGTYATVTGHPLQNSYNWTVTATVTDSSITTVIQ